MGLLLRCCALQGCLIYVRGPLHFATVLFWYSESQSLSQKAEHWPVRLGERQTVQNLVLIFDRSHLWCALDSGFHLKQSTGNILHGLVCRRLAYLCSKIGAVQSMPLWGVGLGKHKTAKKNWLSHVSCTLPIWVKVWHASVPQDCENPLLLKSKTADGVQIRHLNRYNSAMNCLILLKFGSWGHHGSTLHKG